MNVLTSDLVARAQAVADMHDAPISPTQWMYWATQGNLALALLIARSGWVENIQTTTYTVTGSENGVYPLGVEPLALVSVHELASQGLRLLKYMDPVNFLHQLPGSIVPIPAGHPREYRVVWDQANNGYNLNFYPEVVTGYQLYYSYIPQPFQLSLTNNTPPFATSVNYPMGWEEKIVLFMAKRALMREESDLQAITMEINEMDRIIEEAVWNRNLPESPKVRNNDLHKNNGWFMEDTLYPAPYFWYWF